MKVLAIVLAVGVALAATVLLLVRVDCDLCGGSGETTARRTVEETCPHCGGKGVDRAASRPARDGVRRIGPARAQCLYCRGTGKTRRSLPDGPCPACAGTGTQPLYRWLLNRSS